VELIMNETNAWTPTDSHDALGDELARIAEKLDRLTNAVALLDRRRDDLEEMMADVLPAANGAMRVATNQLWAMERAGALDLARETVGAFQSASRTIDPGDLRALGDNAGRAVRTLRSLTGPDVTSASSRAVEALQRARTGQPPGFFSLLRRLRQPHVRRGLGAALDILEALGEGAHPVPASDRQDHLSPKRHPAVTSAPAGAVVSAGAIAPAGAAPSAPVPTTLATRTGEVALDADGFLADADAWSPEVAEAFAALVGVGPLIEEHWRVLDFCRADAARSGGAPGLRRITKELGIPPADMYRLFPKGPGTLAARLSGLKKPKSCV
jgi:tRNA 2-thiouridine synthesizing protein E